MTDTTTEHAPGHWRVSKEQGRSRRLVMAGERCVAIVRPTHQTRAGQGRANARLIAAAPELLAALETAHKVLILIDAEIGINDSGAIARACAALAKARGED